ncbi:MAG: DUF5667 domain-containing protein [Patescibacteria group bacterium]|nr:DUF5667 domain-containing protein [Patescibacteria group bacterium]
MSKLAKYLTISLVVFLLGMTTSFVIADEETVISEEAQQEIELDEDVQPADLEISPPTILPDSPFYFFKNLGRGIRTFFTFNPLAKTELREGFANEKLMELKKMVEMNKNPQAIKKATESYENEIKTVKIFAERIKVTAQENEQVGNFLDKYIQQQLLHQRVLEKLEEQVPAEAFEKIKAAREEHLERFRDVMVNLEDEDKIPERLEKNLNLIKGGDFKEFKNLTILDALKEKLPENIRIRIEEKKEGMLESFRKRLENLPEQRQERLQEYIGKISGDKIKHLDIINSLEGGELSEKLRTVIERVREKSIEGITDNYQGTITKEKAEAVIKEAQSLLGKITNIITEKNATIQEIPDAFRLVQEAEKKLTLTKQEFEQGNYGKAYGQAIAARSLAENAIRIMKIRAGYQDNSATGSLVCSDITTPVCGKDGKTYRNICEAKRNTAEIVHRGECKTNIVCAREGEKVNRNPILGTVEEHCCEGLEEIRATKSYSICKKPGVSFECREDIDCPLSRCLTSIDSTSKCVEGKCVIPHCEEPVVCIQVITPAKNRTTGECKIFSTPCDVPSGWIKDASCGILRLQQKIESQL